MVDFFIFLSLVNSKKTAKASFHTIHRVVLENPNFGLRVVNTRM
jgi:hypothetical protein